jgi:hypothetical protein
MPTISAAGNGGDWDKSEAAAPAVQKGVGTGLHRRGETLASTSSSSTKLHLHRTQVIYLFLLPDVSLR